MEEARLRVLSVFELAQGLKQTIEAATNGCYVEGEVGRLQRPASGHLYFTLKDARRDAVIDCVMYKREALRFAARIVEGHKVQLRGRATFYPPRGRLQWVADAAKQAGQGALLEALMRLRDKLVEEGLTDPSRKRPLPSFPRLIGVVTSLTGAALADVRTVAARRGRVRLLVAPAVVQGDGAVESILRALDLIERAAPDVVILGRGGGAAEDLMAFNDERVVRRVASFSIPIVSAVGHEVDISLTDLVADARAATPSQAAELVVADAMSRAQLLQRARAHLVRAYRSSLMHKRLTLSGYRSRIGDPRYLLFEQQQNLDETRQQMHKLVASRIELHRRAIERGRRQLLSRHPRVVIGQSRARLEPQRARLVAAMLSTVGQGQARIGKLAASLDALSPLSVLGRGYALASTDVERVLRDASTLHTGQQVTVVLQKGSFVAKVEKVTSQVENPAALDHERRGPEGVI